MIKPNFIEIAGHRIGPGYPPFIVAELSANHNGDLHRAVKIVEMAKECGAHAVKLQTYTQDTLTIDSDKDDFIIKDGLWTGRSLYDLYSEAHMPWEWHDPLFKKASDLGITLFSTPFDHSAVDFLENLGAPAYKIASFEVVDLPLIERVAKTGKPMIISTGLANITEIEEAIETARSAGCNELVVLHCVSGYPAEARDYNLATISDIANRFGVLTGLSDHTIDNTVAISAVALGACVIEKHVTLCRLGGGPDDSFSLERKELAQLCRDSEIAWRAYGSVTYERQESEKDNVIFRRSIYAVKDILAGEPFTSDNIRIIRPGYGLAPKHLKFVLNKRAEEDIERGTPLSWDKVRAQEDWR